MAHGEKRGRRDIHELVHKAQKTGQPEIIEDHGKFYRIEGDNFVEVANPNPKSFTIHSPYGDKTFTEGAEEENFFGKYVILRIYDDNGTMDVKYVTVKNPPVFVGDVKNYPMASQAEAIYKELQRDMVEMGEKMMDISTGQRESFTMGFLARGCKLYLNRLIFY